MSDVFSRRLGFQQRREVEITVREDAPFGLRGYLIDLAYESGLRPSQLRPMVCSVLRCRQDPNNWSEFPNIDNEIRNHVDSCEWYYIYDIVERISKYMEDAQYSYDVEKFTSNINDYFIENGIGWQLKSGKVETRGTSGVETVIHNAIDSLDEYKMNSALTELKEARDDLSRRPNADVTGAIHHAMAALECVLREISGASKATLGEIIKRYQDIIPKPLDDAISKMWGYASETARHRREGHDPAFNEAELIVGVSATLIAYILKTKNTEAQQRGSDLPF